MRSLPKFATKMMKKRSGKIVVGVATVLMVVGTFAACSTKSSGTDSASSDYLNPGQSGYDSLPYRHGSLLLPR